MVTPYPAAEEHDGRSNSYPDNLSTTSSNSSVSDAERGRDPTLQPRPSLGSRKSSGIINIDMQVEDYDIGDARTMSPRRSSEEIEKMGRDARQALIV
jgi:hypothetical protein